MQGSHVISHKQNGFGSDRGTSIYVGTELSLEIETMVLIHTSNFQNQYVFLNTVTSLDKDC